MLRSVLDEVDHLRQSEERSLRLLEEALVMLEEFVPGFTVVTSEIRDHLGLPD
jgi:hypothetical protein